MNHTEVVILTRYVAAMCPAQKFDEYTPDAWFDVLGDLRLEDARTAVANVARTQPFIAPAEIRSEVRRIRDDRLDRLEGFLIPPAELSPTGYRDWLIDARKRIADGTFEPDPPEVTADPDAIKAAISGAFHTIPGEVDPS